MGWLATLSTPLRAYGPLAWAAVAITTVFALSVAYWIYQRAQLTSADAQHRQLLAAPPTSVNPLRSSFEKERIRVADFYSPFGGPHVSKTFTACEIVGPGAVAILSKCFLNQGNFVACDIVAVKDARITTAAGFETCTFTDCKFINVTIFVAHGLAAKMASEVGTTDGRPLPIIGYNA